MVYGCIGEKLTHSFSKIIHGYLYDYEYELTQLKREELPEFFKRKDFKAINVTIPYKQEVIPFLDEVSEVAKAIGAVNTIINNSGCLTGFNTDYLGMTELIKRENITVENKKVLILGTGGTSNTAEYVAKSLGAKEILKVSRDKKKGAISYSDVQKNHTDADVIINTTPCGMFPNVYDSLLDLSEFHTLGGVVDAVYNPIKTKLVLDAHNMGVRATGGLYMLVSQAVFSAEKFLGQPIPKGKKESIYMSILADKRNVVLIGMPSCGKSTIGKLIAEKLGKEFIDTDTLVEEKCGMPISEVFRHHSEEYFRETETDVIYSVSSLQGKVIATGGGVVLNPTNIELLKQNGTVFFIDRKLESLICTADRPLSSTRESLLKLYDERYGLYKKYADFVIAATDDANENTEKIMKEFLK